MTGPPTDKLPRRITVVLVGAMLASGTAGLIYEVVWLRLLSLVMGSTVFALSAVLTAFLGGLALGAWLAGRWTQRSGASLRLYAALEAGIGLLALAMPTLIELASPAFGAAYRNLGETFLVYNLVQFLICGLLLLLPTLLMGATLPVVIAIAVQPQRSIAVGAGSFYALNTIGGALGAAAAGFWLVPTFGIFRATLSAAALNLLAALAALAVSGRAGATTITADRYAEPRPPGPAAGDWDMPSLPVIQWLYGASGFAALMLEVAWARLVGLSIGSSTYGFTIILLTFISGLGAGSLIAPRWRWLSAKPVRSVYVLHLFIGLWSVLSLPYLGSLPLRIVQIVGRAGGDFGKLITGETIAVWLTIIAPTLAMGALYPLVAQLIHQKLGASGRAAGSAYASNTLGSILGSFCAGFVFLPTIGMRATVTLSSVLAVLVGGGYLLPSLLRWTKTSPRRASGFTVVVIVITVALATTPGWNQKLLITGPYIYGAAIYGAAGESPTRQAITETVERAAGELIQSREGASGVVTVRRRAGQLVLDVDGHVDAESQSDTNNLLAHYPLMLHGSASDVLVVGLGTGVTLGTVLRYPIDHVDLVEISAEVVEATREHFSEFNGAALDDPRTNVIVGDGRNHLRHAGKAYDVVISQPSNPWSAGSARLFTRESFEEMRRRLAPGGVACAWYVSTDTRAVTLRSVLRTWSEVFPASYLFETPRGAYVMIGMTKGQPVSVEAMTIALQRPAVGQDLRRMGIVGPADLLGNLVLDGDGMNRFGADAVVNTDDNAFIEFTEPRIMFDRGGRLELLEAMHALRQPAWRVMTLVEGPGRETHALPQLLDRILALKGLELEALQLRVRGGNPGRLKQIQGMLNAERARRRQHTVQPGVP